MTSRIPTNPVNAAELISDAVKALEKGDYDNAIVLLRQARASGYQSRLSRWINCCGSRNPRSGQDTIREVEREYQHIVALFAFESTRQMACEALAEFQKEFGDFDPQNLRRFCKSEAAPAVDRTRAANRALTTSAKPPQTQANGASQTTRNTQATSAESQAATRPPQRAAVKRSPSSTAAHQSQRPLALASLSTTRADGQRSLAYATMV